MVQWRIRAREPRVSMTAYATPTVIRTRVRVPRDGPALTVQPVLTLIHTFVTERRAPANCRGWFYVTFGMCVRPALHVKPTGLALTDGNTER